MPYNLILVDDEENIRNGLKKFIDWDVLGFTVVASLSDGKDAIAYIQKNDVDVVLTDIKMTHMSGIDIAKFIHDNRRKEKVVVLSAYDDFQFATEVMKYGAVGYILKTASDDEIAQTMRDIHDKLEREKVREEKYEGHAQWQDEVIPYLKEQLLTDLLTGALSDEDEIDARLKLCNISIDPAKAKATYYNFDIEGIEEYIEKTWHYGREGFYTAVRNFFTTQIKPGIDFLYAVKQGSIKLLALCSKKISIEVYTQQFFELFALNLNVTSQEEYADIYHLCTESTTGTESTEGKQKVNFISLMNEQKIVEAKNVLRTYIQSELGIDFADWFSEFIGEQITQQDIVQGQDIEDPKEKIQFAGRLIDRIGDYLSQTSEDGMHYLIRSALDYIGQNICSDITLEDVAEHVFLSSAYFSRLFKEQMGINFKDYILTEKMTKAKELLQEPKYKIYEISYILGYNCVRFFAKTFKKYSGLTPSEYRSKLSHEIET